MWRPVPESSKTPQVDGWTPHNSLGHANPEQIQWCGKIRAIPFKKAIRPLLSYLEKTEMDALLAGSESPMHG
jgi:hypothetical protein